MSTRCCWSLSVSSKIPLESYRLLLACRVLSRDSPPLRQNPTSSTKPEVHNESQRRTSDEDRATATDNMHENLLKLIRDITAVKQSPRTHLQLLSNLDRQTDRQTDDRPERRHDRDRASRHHGWVEYCDVTARRVWRHLWRIIESRDNDVSQCSRSAVIIDHTASDAHIVWFIKRVDETCRRLLNVYVTNMAASNKTQMVFSCFSWAVCNVDFIYMIIAAFCINSPKYHVALFGWFVTFSNVFFTAVVFMYTIG